MKDKLFRKRNHIIWNDLRIRLEDQKVDEYYFLLRTKNPKMSTNRVSYIALRHIYGKNALDYYRATHDIKVFVLMNHGYDSNYVRV